MSARKLYPLHEEFLVAALRAAALANTDPNTRDDYIELCAVLADDYRSDDMRRLSDYIVQRQHPAVVTLLAVNDVDADDDDKALTAAWQDSLIPFLSRLDPKLRYQLVTQEDDTPLSRQLLDQFDNSLGTLGPNLLVSAPPARVGNVVGLALIAYTWKLLNDAVYFETNDGMMGPFLSWIVPILDGVEPGEVAS